MGGCMLMCSPLSVLHAAGEPEEVSGDPQNDVTYAFEEKTDSADYVFIMSENAPRYRSFPSVPRFMVVGKEGKFYLGLGTNIKAVGVYDFGNVISDPNDFTTYNIPMNPSPGNGAQMKFTAQQSNIYLNAVALPGSKNQIGAFVAFKFTGEHYGFHLQHAYLKFRNITAGYTNSLFSDGAAVPNTIDDEGPSGYTGVTLGTFNYSGKFGKDKLWSAGVGVEMPINSYTNGIHTQTVTQRLPDIPAYIQRGWAGGSGWLRFAGILRNLYYRDEFTEKNVDKVGWGLQLSGTTPVCGGLQAYWEGVYGKGIASYIQDLTGCGMDLMPVGDDGDRLEAVKAWAGYAGLGYTFSSKVNCNLIYSHVRAYANRYTDGTSPWNKQYKYAQYLLGNVFWNITPIVQFGVEYIWGRRVDNNSMQAHDNRIEAMLQVSL